MDKIGRALARLTPKEREAIKRILAEIEHGNIRGLDVKKLKGRDDIFRVRKGGIRIIYRKDSAGAFFVLAVERRREDTYSF